MEQKSKEVQEQLVHQKLKTIFLNGTEEQGKSNSTFETENYLVNGTEEQGSPRVVSTLETENYFSKWNRRARKSKSSQYIQN